MGQLIQIENLHKKFGDLVVLDGVSLDVKQGEVVAIIGASGSGKSTMVRCLAGLTGIDEGQIKIDQKKVNGVQDVSGKVGMVFQNFNLFPHYTVLENVLKPCQTILKMKRKDAEKKAEKLLEKVHLGEKKNQYPSTLSGGQKQRVAIARALAMEPEILVFDEPTSSLDPELAQEVFATMRDLAAEGMTMLIVTHQINAIRQFATRVVYLHQGKIEVEGTTEEMLGGTQNESLQQFLQMVNL